MEWNVCLKAHPSAAIGCSAEESDGGSVPLRLDVSGVHGDAAAVAHEDGPLVEDGHIGRHREAITPAIIRGAVHLSSLVCIQSSAASTNEVNATIRAVGLHALGQHVGRSLQLTPLVCTKKKRQGKPNVLGVRIVRAMRDRVCPRGFRLPPWIAVRVY